MFLSRASKVLFLVLYVTLFICESNISGTAEQICNKSPVFQHLPEPNRACLVGVYAFLIWNNLCDLVYQTPTKSYQSQIPVAFGIPGHVTTKHLPDTPC